ncbi:MAG: hypothetical protein CSA66_05630 [Proteobacteria bacterium]|nr:MAG: hypothetical protein CSA66_05630 [Pseudomonadota bacterium]
MVTAAASPTDLDQVHAALRALRDRIPRLLDTLGQAPSEEVRGWLQTLDSRILPRLSPDFPLLAAVTGGGSSGKSTLFNSLLGAPISTVGGRAGLNRRVLVAVPPAQAQRPDFLAELFRPFGSPPEPLGDRQRLTETGAPVYAEADGLPPGVLLLDTPDFDVGAGGVYVNRGVAEPVLTAMDVLIYIFTNATYNAKSNTDFIREQLTRLGRRPCLLVYRVYRSFSDDEVRAHAQTVADNLYGDAWRPHVMGVFRADDDNAVAAGEAPMVPRRVGGGLGLLETLSAIDPRALRREQTEAMVRDLALALARAAVDARWHRDTLAIYHDTLRLAEGHAIARALAHFPLARVVDRIRQVFERTDPGFLRFSRKAGRVTGAPFRGLMKLLGHKDEESAAAARGDDPAELTRAALVEAANGLRRQTLADELTAATTPGDPNGGRLLRYIAHVRAGLGLHGADRPLAERTGEGGAVNVYVAAPPAVAATREALLARPWAEDIAAVAAAAEPLLELPPDLDAELETIVRDFRAEMSFFNKARAALVASLNLVPPALGIVYVFATVDPVGGTTLSAKLSSVFGLHDLWATVSIPASSGLDEATRRHLKRLLDPVVQRWLASRTAPVEALFRERATAGVLAEAAARIEDADALLDEIKAALRRLPGSRPSERT